MEEQDHGIRGLPNRRHFQCFYPSLAGQYGGNVLLDVCANQPLVMGNPSKRPSALSRRSLETGLPVSKACARLDTVRATRISELARSAAMKPTINLIIGLIIWSSMMSGPKAQTQFEPAAQPVTLRSPAELEQMLSPIALYPDPLIAEILPAATQPAEIVMADRYLSQGVDVGQIDLQPWDGSVKTLARYPVLLRWLDDNLAWTTQLGLAFLSQQPDVMDAIQRLRARALALGNLVSTPQQTVLQENGLIEIVPASPQVVYLPVYQPDLVYADAPPQPGGFISFGIGWPIGVWLNHDFDWHEHHVMVWHHDHPRPFDWWYRRPSERPHETGGTVWHPHAPSVVSEREREGRGWMPGPGHPTVTVNQEGRAPERPASSPRIGAGENRRVGEPSPTVQARETPTRAVPEPRPAPSRAPVPASSRSANGALIGVQSAPETHQFSVRGQESRQAVSQPASAAPRTAPNPAPSPAPASHGSSTPSSSSERSRR